jgi:hypothetical protein
MHYTGRNSHMVHWRCSTRDDMLLSAKGYSVSGDEWRMVLIRQCVAYNAYISNGASEVWCSRA